MTITRIETTHPRIYVACLASYTNGIFHGAWIEAAHEPWDIWAGISAMLAASPLAGAEEWAVHDYEGFGGIRISEHEGIEAIAELAAFIVKHGTLGAALLDHYGNDLGEAREAIESHYVGCHASLADYVQEIAEEAMAIPETLRFYIDWPAMARDTELGGDFFTIETAHEQVHVFSAR